MGPAGAGKAPGMRFRHRITPLLAAALLAGGGVAGCGDDAANQVEQEAEDAQRQGEDAAQDAQQQGEDAAQDAQQQGEDAARDAQQQGEEALGEDGGS